LASTTNDDAHGAPKSFALPYAASRAAIVPQEADGFQGHTCVPERRYGKKASFPSALASARRPEESPKKKPVELCCLASSLHFFFFLRPRPPQPPRPPPLSLLLNPASLSLLSKNRTAGTKEECITQPPLSFYHHGYIQRIVNLLQNYYESRDRLANHFWDSFLLSISLSLSLSLFFSFPLPYAVPRLLSLSHLSLFPSGKRERPLSPLQKKEITSPRSKPSTLPPRSPASAPRPTARSTRPP